MDHSNTSSSKQAALLAQALGLEKVYEAQQKASGYVLLINAESKEIKAKLTRSMTTEEMQKVFAESIDS